jgi:hypothetical protein
MLAAVAEVEAVEVAAAAAAAEVSVSTEEVIAERLALEVLEAYVVVSTATDVVVDAAYVVEAIEAASVEVLTPLRELANEEV